MKRILIVAAALALTALVPALAHGGGPKKGYYEATQKSGGQPFGPAVAKTKPGEIAYLQGGCPKSHPSDSIVGVKFTKNVAVRGTKFHYKGKVQVDQINGGAIKKKAKLAGEFVKHFKKWRGHFTVRGCDRVSFHGKYAGTQLGG
jgi:hypothetical protein